MPDLNLIYRNSLLLIGLTFFSMNVKGQEHIINQGNLIYDFSFVELATEYLESGDSSVLEKISNLPAATHLLNHAQKFHYEVPQENELQLVAYLLNPADEKRKILLQVREAIVYTKALARSGIIKETVAETLPAGYQFDNSLFFTFGYDLGVAFKENASVNLAHPHYLQNLSEIKYYAMHELHHAGFLFYKDYQMLGIDSIKTYGDMARLIEFYTHLEGMGVYASLRIRGEENAMEGDEDYVALTDPTVLDSFESEFFKVYNLFSAYPDKRVQDKDWELIESLSGGNRLWYRVGAYMAVVIEEKSGKEKLISLMKQPPEEFFKLYLSVR